MRSKVELIAEITNAFDGVALDGGVSLDQTKILDDPGHRYTAEEFAAFPNTEIINDWRSIQASTLDAAECVAHLDSRGFRYYIPALILRLLDNYDSSSMVAIATLSSLYPKTESGKGLYSLLSMEQKRSIAHFLEAFPDLVDLAYEHTKIVPRALRNYWSQFLE